MNSTTKALVLLSCTLPGLICGTLYVYSSFSPQLAGQLQYSVTEASILPLIGTAGVALSSPISGLMVDKNGYTLPLLLGGVSIALGYKGLQLQYDNQYGHLQLSGLLLFMIGIGSTFINLVTLNCCAVTFPTRRGLATSLPLALYGLSALFYSSICSTFYDDDPSGFLKFLLHSSLLIFVISCPMLIYCDTIHKRSQLINKPKSSSTKFSNLDNLLDKKFLLLFVVTGLMAAFGQMYIYSVGYMIKALLNEDDAHFFARQQQLQVGMISFTNCLGRLVAGLLCDSLHSKHNKLILLYIPSIGFFVSHCVVYNVERFIALGYISLVTGFLYGFTFCLMPILVCDMFGMNDFLLNWGVMSVAPILPSYYLTKLFGQIYDSRSIISTNGQFTCPFHQWCYNAIFRISLPLGVICVVVVAYLNLSRACA